MWLPLSFCECSRCVRMPEQRIALPVQVCGCVPASWVNSNPPRDGGTLWFMRRLFLALVLLASNVGGGCSVYESAPATSDAGTALPDGGMPSPVPTLVLYVAGESGDDTRAGTSPATALRTVGNAIGLATGKTNVEIRVCRGTYTERNLVISKTMRLRGGYNCSSWERSAETFGFVHGFTDINETLLVSDPSQTERATLTVRGGAEERVFIDGLTLQGTDAVTNNAGAAVLLAGKAALTIEESNIRGGGGARGMPAGPASIGVWATGGVLSVSKSRIAGGSGKSDAGVGSTALEITNAEANVVGSVVKSGTGVGTSCGVGYRGSNSKIALRESSVEVESCTTVSGIEYPGAIGVSASGGETKVTDSRVGVASVTCSMALKGCVTYGILAAENTSVEVARNWIWGVSPQHAATQNHFRGIQVLRSKETSIAENVVYISAVSTEGSGNGLGIYTFFTPAIVQNNAVVGMGPVSAALPLTGMLLQASANVKSNNNLVHLVGSGVGVYSHRCPVVGYPADANDLLLQHNAVYQSDLNMGMRLVTTSGNPCSKQTYLSMQDPGAPATLGSMPRGNVDLMDALLDPPDPAQWLTAVRNRTLKLATTKNVCAIAKKGIDVGGSTTDIKGSPRDPKMPTIGPWEANVACN